MNNIFQITGSLIIILVLSSCNKNENAAASSSFTYNAELQSSKDISYVTQAISDIEMMTAFMGDDTVSFVQNFYTHALAINQNTSWIIRDSTNKWYICAFNNAKCKDGKIRDGSVFLIYGLNAATHPNANYAHDVGYKGRLHLAEYTVDGWKFEQFDPTQLLSVTNTLLNNNYNPAQTNITWEITGKLKITNLADPSRSIVWDGKLTKTLVNTSDTSVFASNKLSPINWLKATVQYQAQATGTHGSNTFQYEVSSNPLIRDANCFFAPAGSVNVTTFKPFISGISNFTISTYHPRTIDHGPGQACDNSGTISFDTETHNVNFD